MIPKHELSDLLQGLVLEIEFLNVVLVARPVKLGIFGPMGLYGSLSVKPSRGLRWT